MAKKNKTGIVIGLAAGAVILYLVTRKTTTAQPAGTTMLPSAPTSGASSGSGNLLTSALNLAKSFLSPSTPAAGTPGAFAPVSVAPTSSGGAASPASGVTYINPTAPALQLPAASSSDVSSTDSFLSDFTFSGAGVGWNNGDLFT